MIGKTVSFLFLLTWSVAVCMGQPMVIKIWPNGAPGARSDPAFREDTVYIGQQRPRIRRVTDPDLTAYFPKKEQASRAAVVICPGGGYQRLAIDHEGHDVARWLAAHGIAGFVLKYRLPSDTIMTEKKFGPLQDVQEAVRILRRRAQEWDIDPEKIGVMGFSAGGHLAGSISTLYDRTISDADPSVSARPDFALICYGALSMQEGMSHTGSRERLLGPHPDSASRSLFSAEMQARPDTPPTFLVHAEDDSSVPVANTLAYFAALRKNNVPAEMHVYEIGGHGFGLGRNRGTESTWPEACLAWLRMRRIIP